MARPHNGIWLPVIALLGMGVLGAVAMLVALVRDVGLVGLMDEDAILLPICFLIGCGVGAVSMPIVLPCLLRGNLKVATPFVYGPSLVIVIWYASLSESVFYPLDCAIPALISVCIMSALAMRAYPELAGPSADLCPECSYDLRGCLTGGCPECGWKRDVAG